MDKPVWLNQETPLYTAVVRKPDGHSQAFLVLTNRGPVAAKEMAERSGAGACFRSQQFPFPLITPSIREIEHLVEGGSSIAQAHRLVMYRFTLDCQGQERICLVWTRSKRKHAAAFAERSLLGKVKSACIVTNPVLMDVAPEELLETA